MLQSSHNARLYFILFALGSLGFHVGPSLCCRPSWSRCVIFTKIKWRHIAKLKSNSEQRYMIYEQQVWWNPQCASNKCGSNRQKVTKPAWYYTIAHLQPGFYATFVVECESPAAHGTIVATWHWQSQVVCRISEPSTVAPEHGPLVKEIRSVREKLTFLAGKFRDPQAHRTPNRGTHAIGMGEGWNHHQPVG